MRVDLHTHTTASDGDYAPPELVRLAVSRKLNLIAITDHDTTEGIAVAEQAAQGTTLTILPGIELSAEDESGDVHMLGYLINRNSPTLQNNLKRFRERRYDRARQIVERLADMGLPVDWERVRDLADGAIGRPHIAEAMIEAGHVGTKADAFRLYLGNDAPAYIARERLSPEQSIHLIHRAGGVAVLAHPGLLPKPIAMVERLVPAGLDGVEVIHPKNPENVRLNLRALAQRHDLIMTGGSDFHRPEDDGRLLLGTLPPPDGCVAALRQRAQRYTSD